MKPRWHAGLIPIVAIVAVAILAAACFQPAPTDLDSDAFYSRYDRRMTAVIDGAEWSTTSVHFSSSLGSTLIIGTDSSQAPVMRQVILHFQTPAVGCLAAGDAFQLAGLPFYGNVKFGDDTSRTSAQHLGIVRITSARVMSKLATRVAGTFEFEALADAGGTMPRVRRVSSGTFDIGVPALASRVCLTDLP